MVRRHEIPVGCMAARTFANTSGHIVYFRWFCRLFGSWSQFSNANKQFSRTRSTRNCPTTQSLGGSDFRGELMVSMGCQPVRQRRISKTKRRSHIEPRGKPYEPPGLAESIFFKCWSVDDDIFAWPKWKRWKGPAYHHLTIVLVLVVFEHTILLWNVWKCVGIVTEATARQNQRLSREGSIRGSVRKSMRSMGSALSQLPEEQEEQDVLLHR